MKKRLFIIFILLILLCAIANIDFYTRTTYTYNPKKAIEYSYQYIDERNPEFPAFENNCITFISQCLHAGRN